MKVMVISINNKHKAVIKRISFEDSNRIILV